MPNVTITVVICAYTEKRWDDLVSAVRSIESQTTPPLEIIVVIDHNPVLFTRASELFHDAKVIENSEQKGLSGGRNTAIAIAQGDVIAFMDEDATAQRDWLALMTEAYRNDQVIAVGGCIIPAWDTVQPDWFPDEFLWVVGCTYLGMPAATASVRNLIGCNMSFRRSVFHSAGDFRNDIGRVGTRPVGCEETELCIRVGQKLPGLSIIYDPRLVMNHRVPAIRTTFSYFTSRCYSEGLSKALVSQYVGSSAGLASERAYSTRVLPAGVIKALKALFSRSQMSKSKRALAIVIGFALTGFGFVFGTIELLAAKLRGQRPSASLSKKD
ncbi:MAG TPA: glycosyltransferase family 2 protein [Anaerolineae bacterium]|jgi:glycosyltransferase involved in cell wall biosynthesis